MNIRTNVLRAQQLKSICTLYVHSEGYTAREGSLYPTFA